VTVAVRTDRSRDPVRVRAAVAALSGGLFLAALDQNLFATTLPTVTGDLGPGSHLFWMSTATVMTGTIVMPVLAYTLLVSFGYYNAGGSLVDRLAPRPIAAALPTIRPGDLERVARRRRRWRTATLAALAVARTLGLSLQRRRLS
jgi:MFS family permease